MNFYPLNMEKCELDMMIKMIKSLFDPSIDNYVRVNRDGYLENSFILDNVKSVVTDDNYDKAINNLLVNNIKGLSIVEEGNFVTCFLYNGVELLMCQNVNIAHNSIYFIFSLCKKVNKKLTKSKLDS